MRRFAWLQSTNLPQDTKTLIEEMAFDESGLFNKDTDATLRRMGKDIKASKSLGLGVQRKPFRKQPTSSGHINGHLTGMEDLVPCHLLDPLCRGNRGSNNSVKGNQN